MAYQLTSNRLEEIQVNSYGDVIRFDPSDARFVQRFDEFLKTYEEAETKARNELNTLGVGNDDNNDDDTEFTREKVVEIAGVQVRFIETLLSKFDDCFGVGSSDKIFREAKEVYPDYLPDIDKLGDIINELVPIIVQTKNTRNAAVADKYSVKKKGGAKKKTSVKEIVSDPQKSNEVSGE